MPPVLIETLRGPGVTGDQDVGTALSKTVQIDGGDGFPDIGISMANMATAPASIDHVVLRVYGGLADDPGLDPLYMGFGWHVGLLSDEDPAAPSAGESQPKWWTATRTAQPNGQPWTKAALDDLDISFGASWDQQNPFAPRTITLMVAEHEVEVWGTPAGCGGRASHGRKK